MSSKTIIGAGLLALMILCALCVLRHYPYTGHAGATTANLAARFDGSKVTLTGTLPDQAAKDRVIAQANAVYGAGNYIDNLTVGGAHASDGWLRGALGLLPFANRAGAGGGIAINGDAVTVEGQAPSEDARRSLVADATNSAGGLALTDRLTVGGGGALLPPFAARLDAGKVTLEGAVPDQSAKDRILAAAIGAFGAGNFIDRLSIAAPGSASFGVDWLSKVLGWLPFLGRFGSKGDIAFNGQTVTVSGEVPTQEIKTRLLDELRALYGTGITVVDQITVTESLLSESEAKVQADLKQFLLKGIEFDTASDKVTNVGAATLDQLAPALAAAPDVPVEISGHTDNRGTEKLNQDLSQRRAQSVKTYLAGKGIAAARMTTRGFGSTQPVADNATPEGQARNRRIEFRVVPKGK